MNCYLCGRSSDNVWGWCVGHDNKEYFQCHNCGRNKKESNMNQVKMRLEDGKDILTKSVEMTDIMIQEMGERHSIMILGRDMHIKTVDLDDTPQWTVSIVFKQETDKVDSIPIKEYEKLRNRGWTLLV